MYPSSAHREENDYTEADENVEAVDTSNKGRSNSSDNEIRGQASDEVVNDLQEEEARQDEEKREDLHGQNFFTQNVMPLIQV